MYACLPIFFILAQSCFLNQSTTDFLSKLKVNQPNLGFLASNCVFSFAHCVFLLARTWDRIQPRVDHPQKRLDVYPNVDCEIRKPFGKRLHDCGKIHYFQ